MTETDAPWAIPHMRDLIARQHADIKVLEQRAVMSERRAQGLEAEIRKLSDAIMLDSTKFITTSPIAARTLVNYAAELYALSAKL